MGLKGRLCDGVRDPMGFHSPNLLEDGYDIRYDSGIAGSQRRGDDDDPYSRAEPCRQRRQESGGRTLNRVDPGLYGSA